MNQEKPEEIRPSRVAEVDQAVTDRKLIEAAQGGDKRAFGILLRRHQRRLFRFIYGLLGSFDQAEDVVQEAFVKAYQAIGTFRTQYDFYPWLSTIARNLAYNQLSRKEKTESLDQIAESGFNPATTDLGPLEQMMDGETQKRFYAAVQALPAQYRSVFVLRHFEEMDYSQIASYLKIPPGTVDSRLYRARKMLMEALQDLL